MGGEGGRSMCKRQVSLGCLCICLLGFVLVPAVCAISDTIEIPASRDTLERDSPQNIAALKDHIAYDGESQEARMDGVISYIDMIGDRDGVEKLQWIQDDYLAAASLITVMQTSDQITALRDDMSIQSRSFSEEAKLRITRLNGSPEGMRERVNESVNAFEFSLNGTSDYLWLSHENARIKVFNRESRQRNVTLQDLNEQGIDIAQARQISDQIDAKLPDLESALRNNRDGAAGRITTELRSLNQQFRNTVAEYRLNLRVQKSIASIKGIRD
jgi:hypothetical protein